MNDFNELERELNEDPALSYKPISGMAILALVLSVLSLGAIAWLPLVLVNLIAALSAAGVIRHIQKSDRYVGLGVAQAALFLAVLGAALALSFVFSRGWYLNRVARTHGDVIANLIMQGGRYPEAFEYSIHPPRRQPRGTDLNEYYRIPLRPTRRKPPGADVLAWLSVAPLVSLEEDGRQGSLRFLRYGTFQSTDPFSDSASCVYEYSPDDPNQEPSVFQMVFLRRDFEGELGVQWRLLKLDRLSGPAIEQKMIQIGGPPPAEDGDADKLPSDN